jgi:putative transposase
MDISTKKKISQTKKETKERRKQMSIKVFEVKIQIDKLSKEKSEKIKRFFLEAKWLANDIIFKNPFTYDTKQKTVEVKWINCDVEYFKIETLILPSACKLKMCDRIKKDIYTLSKVKKSGKKVGKLKFKKEVNSIPFYRYGKPWYFSKKNKIYLIGIGHLKVNGLNQKELAMVREWGPANLIRRPSGYYIQITGFLDQITPKQIPKEISKDRIIGIDMGIKDTITMSNGVKENYKFKKELNRLKRLSRRISKKVKGSSNRKKAIKKFRLANERLVNKKVETARLFVSKLKKTFDIIVIQNENIKGWQSGWFGKQIMESCLGRIKSELKKHKNVIVIDRFLPTTKGCPDCGSHFPVKLDERIFKCPDCGFEEDRDTKSAKCIAVYGLLDLPTEYREVTLVDIKTASFKECYHSFDSVLDTKSTMVETRNSEESLLLDTSSV